MQRAFAGLLALVCLAPACGDDGGSKPPDAHVAQIDAFVPLPADAGVPDALLEPDAASPDAGPSFTGTITLQEVSIQGIPQLGQGLQIQARFTQDTAATLADYEDQPGSPFGCKVWEYTPTEAASALVGIDEGVISFAVLDTAPALPPCAFIPTVGYTCVGAAGAGGEVALVDANMGLWSYQNASITDATTLVGSYLKISDAVTPTNNGNFPIVAVAAADTVVFINTSPDALPETLPETAGFLVVAGVGPIPGTADPGFLDDDDVVTVTFTPGGDGDYEAFTQVFDEVGGGVGDDFDLDTASQALINAIPTDGNAFTLSCAGAGGACGEALGTIVAITASDGPVPAQAPPYYMPPPATKQVQIRCAAIGVGTVNVPAEVSAYLMTSGATRIQTSFLRDNFLPGGTASATYNIVAGHGIIGFTTP